MGMRSAPPEAKAPPEACLPRNRILNLTSRLKGVLEEINIKLHDHIIISGAKSSFSLAENGLL
jgi:DNA repair protein RadC